MTSLKKNLFISFLFLSPFYSFAQHSKIDSILVLLTGSKEDTSKINSLNNLSWEYKDIGKYDSAIHYGNASLLLSRKLNFQKGIADAFGVLGNAYDFQGNYLKSLECYFNAMKIDEALGDKEQMAIHLGNIGIVYDNQKKYPQALEFYRNALKIDEELKNKNGVARHLNNISGVYYSQGLYDRALEYSLKSLKINEELGDSSKIATRLGNIGSIYSDMKNYDKALEYHFKSLRIKEALGRKSSAAITLGNIGTVYAQLKQFENAEKYMLKALTISDSIGFLEAIQNWSLELSKLYVEKHDFQKAYEYYKKYSIAQDSVFNESNNKAMAEMQTKYETDKKEKEIALQRSDIEKKEAVIRQQTTRTVAFAGGCALMIILAGVSYQSYRNKRKAHAEILSQKIIIEEKNKDITDSINYAKRLQQAILPPQKLVTAHLKDSFVLYKPKDIVAGDFYWMEIINDTVLFAVGDCTGHGVPGAMVSVVCSNALNRAVKEFGITEPGKILDKVTELVMETFEKSESEVTDGMDISLCAFNKNTKQILWAGANNPLWISEKHKSVLTEIKPNKQPIGKYVNRVQFTTHNLNLSNGDVIYLFTDGYADQFGGGQGKKFKYSKLKELLLSISDQNMNKQKEILDKSLVTWKGNLEQVDDICIVGIKI